MGVLNSTFAHLKNMGEIKNIVLKIQRLVFDVFLLRIEVIKQLALPGRNKNGNVIFSLLNFFIDLVEMLSSFKNGRLTNIFKAKYVSRTVILIAGILFILATIECTFQSQYYTSHQQNCTVFTKNITSKKSENQIRNKLDFQPYKSFLINPEPPACFAFLSPLKKYLILNSLLI